MKGRKQPFVQCSKGHTQTWGDVVVRERGFERRYSCAVCGQELHRDVRTPYSPKKGLTNNNPAPVAVTYSLDELLNRDDLGDH